MITYYHVLIKMMFSRNIYCMKNAQIILYGKKKKTENMSISNVLRESNIL